MSGPLVVVAAPGAGDGRARLVVAVSAVLRDLGATAFPLDTTPLGDLDGPEVLTWFRTQTDLRAVLWLHAVPRWATLAPGDVLLTFDAAAGGLRVGDAVVVALPAVPAADPAGAGPPGPIGTLVVDGDGDGWPAGVAATGAARLVTRDGRTPAGTPARVVGPPAAATLVAWMATAARVVVLGDPADADVAGWRVDAASVGAGPGAPGVLPPLGPVLARHLGLGVARVHERAPRVSVVIPTFNSAPFVRATIESILEQTFTDFELVVVDDGSTDGTDHLVASYGGDPRLHLHRQANLGHLGHWEASNNRTWTMARGELVARLDGDDVAAPDRLARQVAVFDADRRVGLVHTGGVRIDERGRPQGPMFALPSPYDTRSQLRSVLAANVVAHPTVMVRRALLVDVEAYAGGWASDYDLWLRLARATRFRFLAEPLTAYRVHGGGVSTTPEGAARSIAEGLLARQRARAGLAIGELVPELPPGAPALGVVAAHVELAYHLLAYGGPTNAPLALAELDRALAVDPHPLAGVAAVTAAVLSGDDLEVRRRVGWLEDRAPGVLAQVRAERGPVPEVHGRLLWPELGGDPLEWADDHIDCLGAPVGRVTLRWRPAPGAVGGGALRTVVAAYLERFGPGDPVRLVLDLGLDPDAALAQVAPALDGLEGLADGAALELADGVLDEQRVVEVTTLDVLDRVRRLVAFSDARPLR